MTPNERNGIKMKAIKYILAFAALSIFGSCSDYFDIDRPPQVPWGTLEEFERAPIGAYAGLFSGHEWNMAWVNDRILKSSMGDDVGFVVDPSFGYTRESKEFNTYTEKNFVQLYRVIATVNDALEFVNKNGGNPFPDASQNDIVNNVNRIIGELHFIRAYAYYTLQTTFGHTIIPGGDNGTVDIPIPTVYAKSASEARNPPMGTTQQVYDLIVRDLRKAKELLPEKFEASKHHPSFEVRANRFAASGMLVRTYLQKGSYDSALMECNFIIDQNNGQYDLTEEPLAAFNKSSIARGREVIFYAPFFDDNVPQPNHLSAINHTWDKSPTPWVETYMGFGTVKRLNWMADPQTDTALTIVAKRDKRFTQLITVRYPEDNHLPGQAFDDRPAIKSFTTFFCNKYYRGPKNMRTNVPLIRLAEIYLTRSALRFIRGDKAGATDDLNVVRSRAWNASVAGESYTPVTTGQITAELINDERLIELFNEGDRIDYLRGIKTDIPKGERGPGTDPYSSETFVWSIPNLELNFNDGL